MVVLLALLVDNDADEEVVGVILLSVLNDEDEDEEEPFGLPLLLLLLVNADLSLDSIVCVNDKSAVSHCIIIQV